MRRVRLYWWHQTYYCHIQTCSRMRPSVTNFIHIDRCKLFGRFKGKLLDRPDFFDFGFAGFESFRSNRSFLFGSDNFFGSVVNAYNGQ